MIGLSIFRIAEKKAEISNSVGLGKYFLALIVIPGIIELLIRFCRWYIASKFVVNKDSKIYKFFSRISIILLFVPVFIFAQLPLLGFPNSLFENSDILGYYGAIIGGGVTVFGVYWTLNYESKKSEEEREYKRQKEEEKRELERKRFKEEREYERQKEEEKRELERERFKEEREHEREKVEEERRKSSLPILRFIFHPDYKDSIYEYTRESTTNLNNIYDILLNTSDECSIKKEKRVHIKSAKTDAKSSYRIFQYGGLEIENLGLGAAILSDVHLYRIDKEEIVNNLQVDAINKFIIPPGYKIEPRMLICSNDFSEDDYLCVDFTDIYSNKYRYEISFGKDLSLKYPKSAIEREMVSVLPEQIDTDNT